MVRGLEKFKEYFAGYERNYIIIDGAACDILEENAGQQPRATNDIDILLNIESLTSDFVKRFWEFIKAGEYLLDYVFFKVIGFPANTEVAFGLFCRSFRVQPYQFDVSSATMKPLIRSVFLHFRKKSIDIIKNHYLCAVLGSQIIGLSMLSIILKNRFLNN